MPDRIEPFAVSVEEAALDDLRGRLRRARWPERETVGDWSQGVPLGCLQELWILGRALRLAGLRVLDRDFNCSSGSVSFDDAGNARVLFRGDERDVIAGFRFIAAPVAGAPL